MIQSLKNHFKDILCILMVRKGQQHQSSLGERCEMLKTIDALGIVK